MITVQREIGAQQKLLNKQQHLKNKRIISQIDKEILIGLVLGKVKDKIEEDNPSKMLQI